MVIFKLRGKCFVLSFFLSVRLSVKIQSLLLMVFIKEWQNIKVVVITPNCVYNASQNQEILGIFTFFCK